MYQPTLPTQLHTASVVWSCVRSCLGRAGWYVWSCLGRVGWYSCVGKGWLYDWSYVERVSCTRGLVGGGFGGELVVRVG